MLNIQQQHGSSSKDKHETSQSSDKDGTSSNKHHLNSSKTKENGQKSSNSSNENDTGTNGQSTSGSATSGSGLKTGSKRASAVLPVHVDPLQNDWRQFECNTWHLEPTVRLISWAGSQIEPYGIDYILQRLGFNHARTTIPKWCQRGCMDPLDKILSVIVLKTIQVVKEERKKESNDAKKRTL